MKKTLSLLLAAALCLALLSACGGSASETAAAPAAESGSQSAEPAVTQEETAAPEEPQIGGPVAYDRVFYDGNGLRVTLVSGENRLEEEGHYLLNLRLENGAGVMMGIPCIVVNGWQLDYGEYEMSDTLFDTYEDETYEMSEGQRNYTLAVNGDFFAKNGGDGVSQLSLLLFFGGEEEIGFYDLATVTVEEGETCPVTLGEAETLSSRNGPVCLTRITNPTDSMVDALFLVRALDENGEPLYEQSMYTGALVDGTLLTVRAADGAEELPCALPSVIYRTWYDANGEWIDRAEDVIATIEAQPIAVRRVGGACTPVTAEVLGPADWNDSYTEVRLTWPEDIDRLEVGYTALCYAGDELVSAELRTVNNMNRHYQDSADAEERLLDTTSFWSYGTDRWEVAINYAYPYEG